MWIIELLIFLIVCSILIYRWLYKNIDFFKDRNIAYDGPSIFIRNIIDLLMGRKSIPQVMCNIYNRHDGIVFGGFELGSPILLIRDPQLVKHIMIKDFDHFVNRKVVFGEGSENLVNNSLFLMRNDTWRDMRSTLSPAFTGHKMRQMFLLILESIDEAMKYLKEQHTSTHVEGGFEMDVKDFTTRLTNDMIASAAFGLKVNSFRDKENEFYVKARQTIKFTRMQQLRMIFMLIFPKIARYLKFDFFSKDFTNYFMRLVLDAMKYRKENNIHRPDMIELLMEARGMIPTDTPKTHYREWSDLQVVAQCLIFYAAGFETSSGIMSFAAHELMENPDVQKRLYEEIADVDEQLKGKPVTYELLQKMTYMDMVVSEVLRKWPVALMTDRMCTKDYVYESAETGERVEIKKDDSVRVFMFAIQRDPKYFENPDAFNPERFSDENKAGIDSGTYFPFGLGPRNCIGNRFALLETKAFLYYLVRDYKLEASPKTHIPLELSSLDFQLQPKKGFWIQFVQRK